VRLALLVAAAVLSGLAGAWYFVGRTETPDVARGPSLTGFRTGDAQSSREARDVATRIRKTSGLQTTVPETFGYDEKTAVFALEEGGFRVRVTYRTVSDSRQVGTVLQQLPRGGVTRRVNWIVTIVVGRLR
jgi:hypothetical protein